ncbi:MAG: VWA domain-containing protein [Deltaproteobacteria bacterium]|nr:VWA domain-containing protein [Deltaproteobacteria bacterium]
MFSSELWRWLRVLGPIAIVLPVILACPTRPVETPLARGSKQTPGVYPQTIEKDVDILFLIDNSDSMGDEQEALKANFPRLIDALRSAKLGNKLPNVHIGVITSDLGAGNYGLPTCEVPGGDKGKLQNKARLAGCTPPKDPYIESIEGTTNIPGATGDAVQAVKDAFACVASFGTGGCGFEHQLEAVRRALDPKLNLNPGFVRKDALLAVVFVTDEDDCSAKNPQLFDPSQQGLTDPLGPLNSFRCFEFGIQCDINDRMKVGPRQNCVPAKDYLYKVEDYVSFFKTLKPAGRLIMTAIAGPTDRVEVGRDGTEPSLRPSCQVSKTAIASPAIRLKAVLEKDAGLKADSLFYSICEQDFGPAMLALGKKIVGKLGGQCISSPLLTPGGGLACSAGSAVGKNSAGKDVTCAKSCLDKVECAVEEVIGQGTPTEKSTQVNKCPKEFFDDPNKADCGANCPCWRVVPRPGTDGCSAAEDGSPYGLQIMRKGEPVKGTVAVARCLTSENKWLSKELADMPQCL